MEDLWLFDGFDRCIYIICCVFFCLDAKEPKDQGFIKIG
jgi:hypothetical protein